MPMPEAQVALHYRDCFHRLKVEEVLEEAVEDNPGAILGMFEADPAGGHSFQRAARFFLIAVDAGEERDLVRAVPPFREHLKEGDILGLNR